MRLTISISLLCCFLLTFAGCHKRAAAPLSQDPEKPSPASQNPNAAKFDVCALIKNAEIEAIQSSPIKETKSSGHSNGGLHTAQCFYTATEFSKSVSLSATVRDPDSRSQRTARDFWKETFGRYEGAKENTLEGDKEKRDSLREQRREKGEEDVAPPQKIDGIGEDAYWSGNRVGGALYVLTKNAFVRISVGGGDDQETKIKKSKLLAEKALGRL
jgi:hypothetical protein